VARGSLMSHLGRGGPQLGVGVRRKVGLFPPRSSRVGMQYQCDYLPDVLSRNEREFQEREYLLQVPYVLYHPSQWDVLCSHNVTGYRSSLSSANVETACSETTLIHTGAGRLAAEPLNWCILMIYRVFDHFRGTTGAISSWMGLVRKVHFSLLSLPL
jgi:hypothetical protein